jgi:hypothetical protein
VRKILAIALIALLSGCAMFTDRASTADPKVCTQLPDAVKATCAAAGDAILKGYVALAAANRTIQDNKASGAYTKEYAQAQLDKTIAARKKLDAAYEVFQKGDFSQSLSQANIVNAVLTALMAELTKRAQEQK